MQTPIFLILLSVSLCLTGKGSKDIDCKRGRLSRTILVGEGDYYSFKTQAPRKRLYAPNTKCFVTYKKKPSCPELRFYCLKFNVNNRHTDCRGLDRMMIQTPGTKNTYCRQDHPDISTHGNYMKVSFLSDKKTQSPGAECWLECVAHPTTDQKIKKDDTTTTPTTTTTTTTTPPTTTTTKTTTTTTKSTSTTTLDENTCNRKCGIKNTGKRVVGGANTEVNEYPWMVALYKRGRSLPSCGGTLINSRWIVTAGHCHEDSFPLDVAVLGEHDVTVETETMIKIERNIVYKLRHEAYDSNSLKNDIALFKMDAPVDTAVYMPACLPPHGADYQGKTAWVTGWGTTSEGGQQASVLQELELGIVDDQTCYDAMTGALGTYWGQTFANEQVCAGGEAGKDGCQGDSGGPFVYDRDDVFELIGVVSWGLGCARPGVYGIYSEVDHYLPWIASSISNNENVEVTVDTISCV